MHEVSARRARWSAEDVEGCEGRPEEGAEHAENAGRVWKRARRVRGGCAGRMKMVRGGCADGAEGSGGGVGWGGAGCDAVRVRRRVQRVRRVSGGCTACAEGAKVARRDRSRETVMGKGVRAGCVGLPSAPARRSSRGRAACCPSAWAQGAQVRWPRGQKRVGVQHFRSLVEASRGAG